MRVTIRHTSSTGPDQLDLDHVPRVGDEIEHREHGRSIVSHVYTDATPPVVLLVQPQESVFGWRLDRNRVWRQESEAW